MLCDKLASETTTVQFHPTTLPPLPPQNTGQPFTVIQGLLQSFFTLVDVKSFDFVQMSLVYFCPPIVFVFV